MTDDKPDDNPTAGELLSAWRAAERDSVAARKAAGVAGMALDAARAAEAAADETETAARAALVASETARTAAVSAKKAATLAAVAARIVAETAEGERFRANQEVERTDLVEGEARDRLHDAQVQGSPKNT